MRASRNTTLVVPVYKSRVVELPAPAKRVSIGNPDIADVLILGSSELYILGKDLGTTNLLLWDRNDVLVSAISVTITHDIDGLKRLLTAALPRETIEVTSAQRNIVLSGSGVECGEDERRPADREGLSGAGRHREGQADVQAERRRKRSRTRRLAKSSTSWP